MKKKVFIMVLSLFAMIMVFGGTKEVFASQKVKAGTTQKKATQVKLNQTYEMEHSLYDVDWYTFKTKGKAGYLLIDAKSISMIDSDDGWWNYKPLISVCDSDGNKTNVNYSVDEDKNACRYYVRLDKKARYYIRIEDYSDSSKSVKEISFSIQLKFVADPEKEFLDDSHNYLFKDYVKLKENKEISGMLQTKEDSDFFMFKPAKNGEYQIIVENKGLNESIDDAEKFNTEYISAMEYVEEYGSEFSYDSSFGVKYYCRDFDKMKEENWKSYKYGTPINSLFSVHTGRMEAKTVSINANECYFIIISAGDYGDTYTLKIKKL